MRWFPSVLFTVLFVLQIEKAIGADDEKFDTQLNARGKRLDPHINTFRRPDQLELDSALAIEWENVRRRVAESTRELVAKQRAYLWQTSPLDQAGPSGSTANYDTDADSQAWRAPATAPSNQDPSGAYHDPLAGQNTWGAFPLAGTAGEGTQGVRYDALPNSDTWLPFPPNIVEADVSQVNLHPLTNVWSSLPRLHFDSVPHVQDGRELPTHSESVEYMPLSHWRQEKAAAQGHYSQTPLNDDQEVNGATKTFHPLSDWKHHPVREELLDPVNEPVYQMTHSWNVPTASSSFAGSEQGHLAADQSPQNADLGFSHTMVHSAGLGDGARLWEQPSQPNKNTDAFLLWKHWISLGGPTEAGSGFTVLDSMKLDDAQRAMVLKAFGESRILILRHLSLQDELILSEPPMFREWVLRLAHRRVARHVDSYERYNSWARKHEQFLLNVIALKGDIEQAKVVLWPAADNYRQRVALNLIDWYTADFRSFLSLISKGRVPPH